MPETSETVMAFDFGEKRIGVAIGETLLGQARALETVAESANERRFAAIDRLIAAWHPQRLVVGLPAHADRDAPHELAARCERFARQLAARYRLPVGFCDERYSSAVAEAALAGQGVGGRTNKARLDAEAAAVILQSWFDQQHAAASSRH